jgi:DNA polymerase I-like protein with 3'-5' exonuclease and polymerase domains
MLSAYAESRDLHTLTARSLTGNEGISKDDRKLAKAVNFGLLYGMGAKGLKLYSLRSHGVAMSLEEATLYRRRFFETYPGLKSWHDDARRAWLRGGTDTRTLTGRRRMDVQKLTDRLNAPVQGTAVDGLKLALALLWERRYKCPEAVPVLVCHDEVAVEELYVWKDAFTVHLIKASGEVGSFLIPVHTATNVDEDGVKLETAREKVTSSPGYDSNDVPDDETRRAAFDYYGYPDPLNLGRS